MFRSKYVYNFLATKGRAAMGRQKCDNDIADIWYGKLLDVAGIMFLLTCRFYVLIRSTSNAPCAVSTD